MRELLNIKFPPQTEMVLCYKITDNNIKVNYVPLCVHHRWPLVLVCESFWFMLIFHGRVCLLGRGSFVFGPKNMAGSIGGHFYLFSETLFDSTILLDSFQILNHIRGGFHKASWILAQLRELDFNYAGMLIAHLSRANAASARLREKITPIDRNVITDRSAWD